METRVLRYFMEIVREENMTKAAYLSAVAVKGNQKTGGGVGASFIYPHQQKYAAE